MYPRLKEYIELSGVPLGVYARELGLTAAELKGKLAGEADFTFDEAARLRDLVGASAPLAELFAKNR